MTVSVHVLGAGIVGICCALELARRGFGVTLADRSGPGAETSSGNAGIIADAAIFPEASPAVWRQLPAYLANRHHDVHLHYSHMPGMAPQAARFLSRAIPSVYRRNTSVLAGLLASAAAAHRALAREAGNEARYRDGGWLKLYRSRDALAAGTATLPLLRSHGHLATPLDAARLADLEPALAPIFAGAILHDGMLSVSDPAAVVRRIAGLLEARGVRVLRRSIVALRPVGDRWEMDTDGGTATADRVVVALGAWSRRLLQPLGYRAPLYPERGYHRHFRLAGDARLGRPLHDVEGGYVLSPMDAGCRLTTGAEWARLDGPPTPVQLEQVTPLARQALPLEDIDEQPTWLGNRPQTPDTLPLLGQVPGHPGLWLATGHGHLGFTLGPLTGTLLAQAIDGQRTDIDLSPFAVDRFSRRAGSEQAS